MANLTFIPSTGGKGASGSMLTLDDVPEDVRNDVEEVYKTLKTNPGRMRANFDTLAELNTFIAQVKAYCELRPEVIDGKPAGPIRFRKSPSRDLPKTSMEFRITDLLTEAEAVTEGINESVAEVKAIAAKK